MKRPSYQWYPGDHRRDTALQSCSFMARALWREMLDLMHDGNPYGHLATGGRALPEPLVRRTLCLITGLDWRVIKRLISELEAAFVFSRRESDGAIYSRRMARDEHIREVRAAAGKQGGNPALLDKQLDKQAAKQKPTPAVAVAFASTSSASPARALSRLREKLAPDYWPDLDKLLDRAPDLPGWCGELEMLVEGGTGPAGLTYADLGKALHDYGLNGKTSAPNIRSFRNYVLGAKAEREQPATATPRRSAGYQDADAAGMARAKEVADRIDREAARKRAEKNHAR